VPARGPERLTARDMLGNQLGSEVWPFNASMPQ
jgi:hypothetical protein